MSAVRDGQPLALPPPDPSGAESVGDGAIDAARLPLPAEPLRRLRRSSQRARHRFGFATCETGKPLLGSIAVAPTVQPVTSRSVV